jgi:RNA polymerase sigma-70 factor (ECF subfamily)
MTTETLTELIAAHQTELFRYLKYLGADHAAAEDLVQDAFLRAFRAAVTPDLENLNVRRAWLRRIAHNLFMDHCRRRAGSPVLFDSETADRAEAFWQNEFLPRDDGFGYMEALEGCLEQLPARSREMIDFFYARRRSRDELAGDFGISTDGVKMALRRIRQVLGDCIEQRLAQS